VRWSRQRSRLSTHRFSATARHSNKFAPRMAALVKGFGCRSVASGRPGKEPASESLRRRNPRESDERLAVYGDLARQELWQGMVFAGSVEAESR
jgi:hypothetical protein